MPDTTAGPSGAYAMCPTCGHYTSAWVGGACTVFVPSTEDEVAAGAPWARYCDHDCSVDLYGEPYETILRRAIQGRIAANEPEETP